ncbi:MAG: hypothetical protein PVH11_02330 [Anaerolineae bacterium]|jgi:hypothetical protein
MKQNLTRAAGIALVIAGIGGILFSLLGLLVVAQVRPQIEATVLEQLKLIDQAFATTAEGLVVIDASLNEANVIVDSVAVTMAGVGQTVEDTVPMIDSTADFLGRDLTQTLESAQETLLAASTSAQLIDDLLWTITAIPLIGTDRYNPEVPLHQGLAEIANSLDGIPAALGTVEEGLTAASGNLSGLREDFSAMADGVAAITATVEDARSVVRDYQLIVTDVQELSSTVREGVPRWLGWAQWGLSLALIWLGIAQIGLLTQGWELIGRSRVSEIAEGQEIGRD